MRFELNYTVTYSTTDGTLDLSKIKITSVYGSLLPCANSINVYRILCKLTDFDGNTVNIYSQPFGDYNNNIDNQDFKPQREDLSVDTAKYNVFDYKNISLSVIEYHHNTNIEEFTYTYKVRKAAIKINVKETDIKTGLYDSNIDGLYSSGRITKDIYELYTTYTPRDYPDARMILVNLSKGTTRITSDINSNLLSKLRIKLENARNFSITSHYGYDYPPYYYDLYYEFNVPYNYSHEYYHDDTITLIPNNGHGPEIYKQMYCWGYVDFINDDSKDLTIYKYPLLTYFGVISKLRNYYGLAYSDGGLFGISGNQQLDRVWDVDTTYSLSKSTYTSGSLKNTKGNISFCYNHYRDTSGGTSRYYDVYFDSIKITTLPSPTGLITFQKGTLQKYEKPKTVIKLSGEYILDLNFNLSSDNSSDNKLTGLTSNTKFRLKSSYFETQSTFSKYAVTPWISLNNGRVSTTFSVLGYDTIEFASFDSFGNIDNSIVYDDSSVEQFKLCLSIEDWNADDSIKRQAFVYFVDIDMCNYYELNTDYMKFYDGTHYTLLQIQTLIDWCLMGTILNYERNNGQYYAMTLPSTIESGLGSNLTRKWSTDNHLCEVYYEYTPISNFNSYYYDMSIMSVVMGKMNSFCISFEDNLQDNVIY